MLVPASSIAQLRERFSWQIPSTMNMAGLCCTRHADERDRPALILADEGRTVGFRELERRVSKLAHVMAAHGVGRGDRVAYLGLNSPQFLLLLFACARLGALFIPLNWRLAGPEHVFILTDSTAKVLVDLGRREGALAKLNLSAAFRGAVQPKFSRSKSALNSVSMPQSPT